MVNHISDVAKLLGLRLGQEFSVDDKVYWFTKDGLRSIDDETDNYRVLGMLIDGTADIAKLPSKPHINDVYFIPNISNSNLCTALTWTGDDFDIFHYRRGLVCESREEAKKLAKTFLAVAGGHIIANSPSKN